MEKKLHHKDKFQKKESNLDFMMKITQTMIELQMTTLKFQKIQIEETDRNEEELHLKRHMNKD